MASQMEWSHDFCLSCDRQIAEGGTYCSQACRLADLEKAGSMEQTPSQLSSSASSTSSSTHGFYLPPAVNFSALKTPTASRGFDLGSSSSHQHYYSTANGSYYAPAASNSATTSRQSQQRSLTPSSSRSSLQSATQSTSGISLQAANQLNGYVRSFDQVRDMKRRYHY